ncbi:hypothetical protein [Algoriphagus sp. A40]|uniref:hypothetical protein n=1 Tax=Algoriphagus sp. A40 TaxID=1945863 RepID=UPI00111570D1|nr:hypothetical protein [Algoriphagus sp. A40]
MIKALFKISRLSAGLSLILGFCLFMGSGEVIGQCQTGVLLSYPSTLAFPKGGPSITEVGWEVEMNERTITYDLNSILEFTNLGSISGSISEKHENSAISSPGVTANWASGVIYHFFPNL